jgi:hypothetical protein
MESCMSNSSTSSGPSPSPAGAPKKALSGWQNQNAERRAAHGGMMRRVHRAKALKRGEADPIFIPGTRELAPDFQEAVDRFMSERKLAAE